MKRKYIPIHEALKQGREFAAAYGNDDMENCGMCALYDIEDMGFCKDGVTKWYWFTSIDGEPAYTLKR